jgi:hypothetical protein
LLENFAKENNFDPLKPLNWTNQQIQAKLKSMEVFLPLFALLSLSALYVSLSLLANQ